MDGARDHTRVEQLRAFEANAVATLEAKLDTLAKPSLAAQDRHDLLALVRGIAAAQREDMLARRAADRVKKDALGERPASDLTSDEVAAVRPLQSIEALRALMKLDVGKYTHDAHVLAVLSASDRMEIARNLPMRLQVFAMSDVYTLLFGAKEPSPRVEATTSYTPGALLACLTEGARAAGHPVPSTLTNVDDRNLVAWGGILAGFADLMRPDLDAVSAQLRPFVDGAYRRLRAESTGTQNYLRTVAR
jgi:hypothetical protein